MGSSWHELNRRQNPKSNSDFDRVTRLTSDNIFFAARVTYILLDDSDKTKFKNYDGWNALGLIEYDPILSPTGQNSNTFSTAYPFFPNSKNYPLINEIVYIMQFPNQDLGNTNASQTSYYLSGISIWNHPHHNAYPSLANEPPPPQQKDYAQTQAGSAKVITNQNKQIFLGKTFKEKLDIHPLRPFEGDVIHEGRWGNSIRLGSTVQNTPNNWSSVGNNGDPIIIIRNGQPSEDSQPKNISGSGWIPIVEDIKNDDSSIYLTSTQNIPLTASSTNYLSYTKQKPPQPPGPLANEQIILYSFDGQEPPQPPDKFAGSQIILDSGRLVFNTSYDHILLSSAKSINLNSQESVNIDTPSFIVQSNKMYLGSYEAKEPLLKGNLTVNVLRNLIQALKQLNNTLKTLQTQPVEDLHKPVGMDPKIIKSSVILNTTLNDIEKQLNDLTSESNFTI